MSVATVTISGRLASDPTLRRTAKDQGVCNFTVAHTERKLGSDGTTWEDASETLWLRVTAWGRLGENVAASLHKGDAVTVSGRIAPRTYQTEAGEIRTEMTCQASSVAVDLDRATVVVTRFGADADVAGNVQPLRRSA